MSTALSPIPPPSSWRGPKGVICSPLGALPGPAPLLVRLSLGALPPGSPISPGFVFPGPIGLCLHSLWRAVQDWRSSAGVPRECHAGGLPFSFHSALCSMTADTAVWNPSAHVQNLCKLRGVMPTPESCCGIKLKPQPHLCTSLHPCLASFPSLLSFSNFLTESSALINHLPSNTQLKDCSGQPDLRYLPSLHFLGNYSIIITEIYRIHCKAFLRDDLT